MLLKIKTWKYIVWGRSRLFNSYSHNACMALKTLFDMLRLDLKSCWTLMSVLSNGVENNQPGIQNFWNLCGHYQDIYDWISPFNKPSDWWFILTQKSMVENEYMVYPNTCLFCFVFISLKHFMMLFKCIFSGLQFYTLEKTIIS